MRTNLLTVLLPAVLSIATSCVKEKANLTPSPQTDFPNFYECYHSHPHDSLTVINQLIGTWDFQKQNCMIGTTPPRSVKVTFSSSGFFAVIENSNVTALGSWQIKMIGSNFFSADSTAFTLNLSQASGYLNGLIMICDNQVVFADSYVDGCDTYFKKE